MKPVRRIKILLILSHRNLLALTMALVIFSGLIMAGCSTDNPTTPEWIMTPSPSIDEEALREGEIYRELRAEFGGGAGIQELIEQARNEGGLTWTGYDQAQINAWCSGFTRQFDIPCTGRAIRAGQIVTTLVAENQAGEAVTDVVYLSMSQMAQYVDRGLAAHVDWSSLGVAPQRAWSATTGGNALGVIQSQYAHFVNTNFVGKEALPRTVFDWLDPQWAGLVCAPDFLLRAGNGFLGLLYDPDTMVELHKQFLRDQDVVVTADCDPLIVSGERPLMYMGYGMPDELLQTSYIEPFWNPGMGVNLFSHAVAADAPHPQAARLFAAWTTSRRASELSWKAIQQGWPAFGHGPKELVSGRFADLQLVYESPSTYRVRGERTRYFQDSVFGGGR